MAIVRVLGPVGVVADEGSVQESGWALRRTLLALLAIHRGVVLSPDWLMEHVWGDEQPDSGVRALRFHVSQLRKECDAAPIATRPGGYELDLPAGGVDAGIFEELARQARVEPGDLRSVELCDRALALWRGEPFVDVASCSTLEHEAGRLDELRLAVTEYASFVGLRPGLRVRWSRICHNSSTSIRCVKVCARRWSSPTTAPGIKPRRWRAMNGYGPTWPNRSDSTRHRNSKTRTVRSTRRNRTLRHAESRPREDGPRNTSALLRRHTFTFISTSTERFTCLR